MFGLGSVLSGLSKLLSRGTGISAISVRNNSDKLKGMNPDKYPCWKMLRDVRRRKCAKEHSTIRVRLISMKRNDILPPEVRELAALDLNEIPRHAALRQLTYRCVLTSRARGVVPRWRVSRIVFRDLADYNKLSGVQRAMW